METEKAYICLFVRFDNYYSEYLLIPRKRWPNPDMTEKLLTGVLNLNTNKQKIFKSS